MSAIASPSLSTPTLRNEQALRPQLEAQRAAAQRASK